MTKYQPYPQYQESGIGWIGSIPENWSLKKTKYLFRIVKRIAGELGHDVLSITQRGIKVKDIESGEGQLAMDYSKYQIVEKGDFAMNHMDLLTGYVDVSKYDGVISPDYRVFKLKDKDCDPQYFLYLYQKAYWDKLFYPLGQGSSQLGRWRFPSDEFHLFEWPVPPKKEQTIIAQFLDQKTAEIKAFIKLKEKTIALLKERKTAIINQVVTKGLDPNVEMKDSGIEWLGEIPKHWGEVQLKRRISVLTDYTANGSFADLASNVKYIDHSGYARLVRLTDIRKGFRDTGVFVDKKGYEYLSKSSLHGGEVLMANVGAYSGYSFLLPETLDFKATLAPNMFLIKFDDSLSNEFAIQLLNADSIRKQLIVKAISAAQPKLNKTDVKTILIPIPPKEEQKQILNFIDTKTSDINQSISQAEKEIALVKEYQQSLISEAVTGKIDVRGELELDVKSKEIVL